MSAYIVVVELADSDPYAALRKRLLSGAPPEDARRLAGRTPA